MRARKEPQQRPGTQRLAASTLQDFCDWTGKIHRRADGQAGDGRASLACSALGICGELAELAEDGCDELHEAGDVLSYAFLAAHLLELDVSSWIPEDYLDHPDLCAMKWDLDPIPIGPRHTLLNTAIRSALKFAELIKKLVFQGKPYDAASGATLLRTIVQQVASYAGYSGYSMHQIILANTIKLESRYPSVRPS